MKQAFHYDPETKAQTRQWKHFDSPHPKKARVTPSAGKVMLTGFWDQHGVKMDFLAKGTTVTGATEIAGTYQNQDTQNVA